MTLKVFTAFSGYDSQCMALQNFAEPGQRILDTHGGSMSHAIAAHKLGFDLTIIEKDPVYYEQAKKRLIEFQRQQVLF